MTNPPLPLSLCTRPFRLLFMFEQKICGMVGLWVMGHLVKDEPCFEDSRKVFFLALVSSQQGLRDKKEIFSTIRGERYRPQLYI